MAKGGPKVHEWAGDLPPTSLRAYGRGRLTTSTTHEHVRRFALTQLREPVFDRTALIFFYDVDLQWTPEEARFTDTGATPYPDIFGAVQQQLGLKLEQSKEPLEVM